ncbi:SDR family NAD(P)-dependent oxidoreductase [Trichocoleus sp. FACHB-591]|uniref:type I polyketide synthase n=1 Tax=Trichocoleus sp. FACHB-591 TaxID=2692872 RepID=UPI001688D06B|nr:type I polyketide synthase [Trichocoleus sp. FACHB-591]MBD2095654.1 SDR family NAD(P)-dependent oxidoreductase [Trichocoleus sp. FACHB-591]
MTTHSLDGIAIIGMTGRFPGAKNIQEFWHNLQNGVEAIAWFSDEELLAAGVEPDLLQHPNYVKAGAVLDGIDQFDAAFFGYSPREAETLDPQQRLFLECAWEGLEHAGYDPQRYDGRIGVYAGVGWDSYLVFNLAGHPQLLDQTHGYQTVLSNEKDHLTTRVSYKLNLKGPSLDIQTACSTSLVATNLACQSLLSYQCDMALAGGVTISVPHRTGYLHQTGGILSPDGHCRAFDAQAAGTVAGNGVGVVVLKRLEDAIADRDMIYAVIKGTAINNDGAVKVGYTAPSVEGQAEAIAEALAVAEIEPETISYVETHGTGTALGDPIEISALTQAFRSQTEKKQFCAIGSVKTNIGHLDAAAGVTSLIKTILALHHQQIPPSLHFEQPNPQIDFANSPFYVNTKLTDWKTHHAPRRAGVSSFGIGGTNAHAVLEEAPKLPSFGTSRPWQLLLLSAKTASALEAATTRLSDHLVQHPQNLADVAHTLQVGRQRFNHRRMVVCRDNAKAIQILRSQDPKQIVTHVEAPQSRSITFLFPGQGAQYVGMGQDLYQTEPVFREWVDRGSELLKPTLGLDLRDLLYRSEIDATEQLQQTAIAQPAIFLVEYALAQLWMSWGVQPQTLTGHSVGEYVAACLAGVFSFEDALKLVAKRGQLMQSLPTGSMLAVSLSETQIKLWLNHDLSLAAINAPNLCVVSGTTAAIEELRDRLTAQNIDCRLLHTSHAFHSTMMEPILASFRAAVSQVKLQPPTLRLLSNLTGTWMTAAEASSPDYWVQHLRQPVRFSGGISQLLQEPNCILLEVGPGRTLSTLIRQHQSQASGQIILSSLRHPKDAPKEIESDISFLLNVLGRLWLAGVEIDWSGFYAHEQRRRLPLPTYPFERQRYWIDPPTKQANSTPAAPILGKKPNVSDWFYVRSWQQSPLVAPAIAPPQHYLILADSSGIGSVLASQLEQAGHTVTIVMLDDRFTQKDERTYTINSQSVDNYRTLLQTLPQAPNAIAHCWNLEEKRSPEEKQSLEFYSLLYLTQALAQQNFSDRVHLTVITQDLYDITGQEALDPTAATSLGFCRVLPREQLNLTCSHIDLDSRTTNASGSPQGWRARGSTIQHLTTELCSTTQEQPFQQIAYRGRHRWVQSLEPVNLEPPSTPQIQLQPGGVYLITGGLGGIGLSLARYLAELVQAKLVLVSRSGQAESQTLQALEALGAEVLVVQADVTNREQMRDAIAQTLQRFGKLNGVIHAAGIAGGGIAQLKTFEAAAAVLAPKVQGTLVLEEVLRGISLDFLCLCSSLSSIIGEFGQTDYCAANAFLDAFAHYWTAKYGSKAIAINWDTWQQVGMAVNTTVPEALQQQRAASLQQGLTTEEGIEVFQRVLHSGLPQVIVSTQNLQAVVEQHQQAVLQQPQSASIDQFISSSEGRSRHHLLPHSSYVAPHSAVEQQIADIWQDLLGVEPIGIHDSFFELGGHSLLAVQAVSRLRDLFQVELPLRVLLSEASTIAELAQWIESQQPQGEDLEAIAQLLADIENLTPEQLQTQLETSR